MIDDARGAAYAAIYSLALFVQTSKRRGVAQVHRQVDVGSTSELYANSQEFRVVCDSMHRVAQLGSRDQATDGGSMRARVPDSGKRAIAIGAGVGCDC